MATSTSPVNNNVENLKTTISSKITELTNQTPGQPSAIEKTIFKVKFKKGQISQEIYFQFEDNQKKAELAAREYCARFKFRFIWCEKFFQDINATPTTDTSEDTEEKEFITKRDQEREMVRNRN